MTYVTEIALIEYLIEFQGDTFMTFTHMFPCLAFIYATVMYILSYFSKCCL